MRDRPDTIIPFESFLSRASKIRFRGFAFVKFKYAEDADKVLTQKEAHILDGSKVIYIFSV